MVKIIGRLKDIGIAAEAVRGTGTVPEFWLPKNSVSIEDKVLKGRQTSGYGSINMEGNQTLVAREWSEGDLEFDLYDRSFGLFLYALLGAKSVSGPSDSAYTHSFTLAETNQHQSLSITVKESTIGAHRFTLSMINSLEIAVTTDDIVKVTVNFMGKKGTTIASPTVTYTAENKFVGRHLKFKLATLTSGLGAASVIPLKRLVLRFEKNTILDHNLGTVQPTDILNQALKITGEVELDYQDRTYRDLMADGSYRAVRIQLVNNNVTIGAATNPSFTIDLSRVDFEGWESQFANDEIAKQTFNFHALYDVTNGNVINSCQLVNTEAAYG